MRTRRSLHQKHTQQTSVLTWVLRAALLLAAIWFVGFVQFVYALPDAPPEPVPQADGIVALTGGEERIVAAMALLSENKAKRLLISGVHPETTLDDLKREIADPAGRFTCCVDLDRAARNTAGNAIETARWVRKEGYRSLIVVTAQYHMPRSLIEIERELPDVTLIAYPVYPGKVRARNWWRAPGTARLLASEYTKYLVARLRIALARNLDSQSAAAKPA